MYTSDDRNKIAYISLFQAKHDDFKARADKLQQQYLQEIEQLDGKVKELQEELKKAQDEKDDSFKKLKVLCGVFLIPAFNINSVCMFKICIVTITE